MSAYDADAFSTSAFDSGAFDFDGTSTGTSPSAGTAMSTQLALVNKLLCQLRETEVSTVASNSYSKLLAMFINQAKDDMEDVWFWSCNEYEIDVSILADGTRNYDLPDTNDRSFLQRRSADKMPMAFDVTDGEEAALTDISLRDLNRARATGGYDDPINDPNTFAINPAANGRTYGIELLSPSATAKTWRTYWYIPQTELATDGSADDVNIILPNRYIYLKALFYALNERGEEMGEPGSIAEVRANLALSAAMEIDMQVNKVSDSRDITNLETLRNRISGAS